LNQTKALSNKGTRKQMDSNIKKQQRLTINFAYLSQKVAFNVMATVP